MIRQICRSEIDLVLSRTLFSEIATPTATAIMSTIFPKSDRQECREWKSETAEATHEEAQILGTP